MFPSSIEATPPGSPRATSMEKLKPPPLPAKRPRDKIMSMSTPPASPRLRSDSEVVLKQQTVFKREQIIVESTMQVENIEISEKQLSSDRNNNDNLKLNEVPRGKFENKDSALSSPKIKKEEKSPTYKKTAQPTVKVKDDEEEVEVVMREKV